VIDPSSAGFGGSAPIADYAASTGAFRQAMAAVNHAQEGDPAKLGQVLVELRTRQRHQAARQLRRRP
jgi:hypothetical protein